MGDDCKYWKAMQRGRSIPVAEITYKNYDCQNIQLNANHHKNQIFKQLIYNSNTTTFVSQAKPC